MTLSDRELAFVAQHRPFVDQCLKRYGFRSIDDVPPIEDAPARVLDPTVISNPSELSDGERKSLAADLQSELGVAYFATEGVWQRSNEHAIHVLAGQLEDLLPLSHPVEHPMEKHERVLEVASQHDGTAKVFSAAASAGAASSTNAVESHIDGLGCVGTVALSMLFMESPPLAGGLTHFRNVARLSLDLARRDPEAFQALFLPDMIEVLRNRGSWALRVVGPVLFLGVDGCPRIFVRAPGGEYEVRWRQDSGPARRAAEYLQRHLPALAPGSTVLSMSRPGHGCIFDNSVVAHGRTAFIDGEEQATRRVLARKWYACDAACQEFRHAPGVWVHEDYAGSYPELFGEDARSGIWAFDAGKLQNVRRSPCQD